MTSGAKLPHALGVLAGLVLGATAMAEIVTETLEYEHEGTTMLGYLAYDDEVQGERPGVLVVHEWYGLNDYAKRRARELAELGYVALAADMYGGGKVASGREEAARLSGAVKGDTDLMRGRANAALDALADHRLADDSRLGAIGYCFGGTVVLELARSGAPVDAVVSFHGGLGTDRPAEKGEIEGTVMVANGYADPLVSMEERQAFMEEMADANADFVFTEYADAKHSFTNPNAPASEATGYDEQAARRSWAAMRDLFEEKFAR